MLYNIFLHIHWYFSLNFFPAWINFCPVVSTQLPFPFPFRNASAPHHFLTMVFDSCKLFPFISRLASLGRAGASLKLTHEPEGAKKEKLHVNPTSSPIQSFLYSRKTFSPPELNWAKFVFFLTDWLTFASPSHHLRRELRAVTVKSEKFESFGDCRSCAPSNGRRAEEGRWCFAGAMLTFCRSLLSQI